MAGLRVLVTRPREQADELVHLIEADGGQAIRFPVLEITDPVDPAPLSAIVRKLGDFDLAIFISPNAVRRAMPRIRDTGGLPPTLRVACIGHGGARVLETFGVSHIIVPSERFDSEGLLMKPELQNVSGKRIVIFRGDGGRELLGDTLKERGAQVELIACYRRVRPVADATALHQLGERGQIDIMCLTSADGLRNLFDMIGPTGHSWLLRTPVIVVSERMVAVCRELGFQSAVRVAASASDDALIKAIRAWRSE